MTGELSAELLPKHIAVIMDGNGRWAKEQGKARVYGHNAGVKAVRKTISAARRLKIQVITLFAFSQENWNRPQEEVSILMELFITALSREVKRLHKNDIQLRVIGDISQFSARLQKKIRESEALTANNTGLILNVAANYGGKWDITNAFKQLALQVEEKKISVDAIDENTIALQLTMSDLPDVDLMIRTSGEYRISNFMLWQMAYAELYFTEQYWPDFNEQSLLEAIAWFVTRERRFGCTSEQIQALMDEKDK